MSESLSRAIVITATPGQGTLDDARLAPVRALADAAALLQEDVLGEGDAWQALIVADETIPLAVIEAPYAAALAGAPADLNVIPDDIALRRKHVLVADMESTIIEQEMLDELGDLIGKRDVIEDITARAMRGELDFESALKERIAMLAGLDARVLDEVAERITLMPGAEALIRTMSAHGAYCALVSGGFTVFTQRIAERLGFDEHQANTLEIIDGRLTGRVVPPILGREAKLDALRRIASERGVDMVLTLAVGDGANDLDMLREAGLGVAFRAKPKVREAVAALDNGAVITHGDLTALLYLQAYSQADFA
jgi:phosphoserine phosphatase